jgi:amino acid adenylation domain-containing protein
MHSHDPVIVAMPGALTITALFRAQVARAPQSVALEFEGRSLSYAELDAWSDELARRLVAAGVRRGDLVGIRGIRCAETVVGLLGILKAGAAYLPLSPSDPSARLRRILKDAAPVAVLEPEDVGRSALPFTGPVLNVTDRDGDGGIDPSVDLADVAGEDLAYVCYTSGSTGQPKGVMIPHCGVVRLVRNTNYIDIRPEDVFLQFAPLSFDASTFEIWGALLNGARLAIYPSEELDLADLARFIAERRISVLFVTTALFNSLVEREPDCLRSVHWVLMGGEVVSVVHVKRLLPRLERGCFLVHCYGPTENTTFTTCHRMDRTTEVGERIPIGVPVTATEVVILDSDGAPAPAGVPGEMLIGGTGLALGYLNSPELDAEKFVEIPAANGEKGRFYRSGDLGAWNSDGTIDFRSRMDEQVKIRGFRIEPGEIESALREVTGIRDAIVAIRERDDGEKTLAAFMVRSVADGPDAAAIKAELAAKIPDYMVPAEFHLVENLPVTAHGKVDRRALLQEHADEVGEAAAGTNDLAPRDLLEHRLAAIWSRLFRKDRIGRNDNFFELGGHSLLAAELVHEVEKLVGHRFPIARVFQAQTIAELAAMVEGEEWAPAWSSLVPLRVEGDKPPLFFVHGYGGDVYGFLDLVRAMKRGRPVYGVQAVDVDGRQPHHKTMEEMAAHYAREIRSLQPEGPYHLAGFSLGGWIAYAVAQELRGGGQEVAFLGLFDTGGSANVTWYHYYFFLAPELALRALRKIRLFRRAPADAKAGYLTAPLRMLWYLLTRSRSKIGAFVEEQGWEVDRYNILHTSYRPETYGGSADVFLASEGSKGDEPRIILSTANAVTRFFWKCMVRGGVRFHRIPGKHLTMLSGDNARSVATAVDAVLEKGCENTPSGGDCSTEDEGKTMVDLFELQAGKTPDAPAVRCGQSCLSYRKLNDRADELATLLFARGVRRGERVAVLMERSVELLPALLAILKCGASYVPLDLRFPVSRLQMILEEVQPVLVATQKSLLERIPDVSFPLLCVDERPEEFAPTGRPEPPRPGDVAYIIYTSGSTGLPKGVEIGHAALSNLLRSVGSLIGFRNNDEVVVAATAISFDISVLELFLPLVRGSQVVLATEDERIDPQSLIRLFERYAATFFQATPTMWQMLLQAGWRGSEHLVALTGGEALTPALAGELVGRCRALWNLYGPSETTIYSSGARMEKDMPVTIGWPIDNTLVHVVNEEGALCKPGETGELWIGGIGLAHGYFRQPLLTAQRFVPSPFPATRGERFFRTGDLVSANRDGTLSFHGRSDHQVKVQGHRIELGEIEAVLCRHPLLSASAVAVEESPSGKHIVAFVVSKNPRELSSSSLRAWIGRDLPDYMIPSRFVLLDSMPVLASGKVNRQVLFLAGGREVAAGTEYIAPRLDLEHLLCEIWQDLLSRDQIGVRDDFFAMGGNSLLAAVCCARVAERAGFEVPLRLIFENPTIEALLLKLGTEAAAPESIPEVDRSQGIPASPGQEGLWFLRQFSSAPAAYNEPLAFRLGKGADAGLIRSSLEQIMARHEILRTALVYDGQRLLQKISQPRECGLVWSETFSADGPGLDELLRVEATRPFDLSCAPLWRAMWVKLAAGDGILLLTFHHSIIDEWSMRLLVAELETIYAGKVPDELRLQFADYAAWVRRRLAGGRLEIGSDYWRQQLSDIPPPFEWPTASRQPKRPTGGGETHSFRLDAAVVAKLRNLAREEGTTVFVVMLAAFEFWLHRNSGRDDIIVGTPFADRSRAEVQPLIGYFLNTLPIRTKFRKNENFREVVRRVRGSALAAFNNADFPFAKMVELAISQRGVAGASLFQAMFVLLEQSVPAPRLGNAASRTVFCDTRTAKFDLTLFINAADEMWDCRLEYSTDLFSAADVAQMANEMVQLFGALAEDSSLALL